ncbi:MAG TPA: Rieske 2Fe-2S domain-containing protein [Myxococcota bacterium]|nr:Rieske 2Fe-2S domain-containing protein [Myxococcota bacterium]
MKRIPLPHSPNGWFKVAFSDELAAGEVRPVHMLGRDLVVYRGEDGAAHVLDAYCPHLGAHLGVGGTVVGSELRCPFHGWRWAGDGRCTDVPYAKKIPALARIHAWETREQNGYVMVWHHAEGKPPEFEVPLIPEATDPGYYKYKRVCWELATHIQEMYENAVDIQHFAHVHGMQIERVNWQGEGAIATLVLDLKRDASQQTNEAGESSFRSFMYGPGLSLTRVTGRLAGVSIQTLTPLDDELCEVVHTYYAKKSEPATKAELEGFFDFYASDWELDFKLWNQKIYRPQPLLAENDGDVGRFRRWYKQFYSTDVGIDRF